MATEKQKQSLYFPEDMLREIMGQATRLDRSLSWTVQQAWNLARAQVQKFPSAGHRPEPQQEQPAEARAQEPIGNLEDVQPSAQVREFLRGKFENELRG
jgi:uncharacterized small protein (TIGR04563 family)